MSYIYDKKNQKENLRISAELYIRDYIKQFSLKSGDLLPPEKELSEKLNISRTAVREALKGLESLGITKSQQGKGHFVREFNYEAILSGFGYAIEPSLESFKELLEIRMYLESNFLTRGVLQFTAEDISSLYAILEKMGKSVDHGIDENVLIDDHMLFHHKLHKYSDNSLLLELISMFSALQHKLTNIHKYYTSDRKEFIRHHLEIVQAIETGHPEMVRSKYITHFSEPFNWVQQKLKIPESAN
jgi:GntR family transcriptional regulator, transcriptional repressor for pyruvate dehydrogenase complex